MKNLLGSNVSFFCDKEKHFITYTTGGSGSGIQDNSSDESFNKKQVN
jgi:hypothetical protein